MEKTQLDPAQPIPPPVPGGAVPAAPAADTPDLRVLGEYRILRRLGQGGMGQVYLGYDGNTGHQVALKVLDESLADNQGYVDRFYREARSGRQLDHPNIVHTYQAGQDSATGKHYLVMEYVDGPSAQALLQGRGPMAVGDALHLALDIARALEHAHSRNFVHRDIKPDNILITRSGVAKLADMGLAKRRDEASHLTVANQGFGTTPYMPYEQAVNARNVDGRSDIYALGATLYHLVTGKLPFPGENHLEVVEKKKQGWYPPISSVVNHVPSVLDQMIARMLAREPRDRYQTASELLIDLERSRLAAPIPSYADPELAANEPLVQAALGSGEPTRLRPEAMVDGDIGWIVHYRNERGRPVTTRLTAEEIIERLREGTLPADAEARRPEQERGRPLAELAEFAPYITTDHSSEVAVPMPSDGGWVLALVLLLVALSSAGVLVWLFRLWAGR